MLLVIAGMRRSASTLSYQLSCELVNDKSSVRRMDILPKGIENKPDWYVVKTHRYHPEMLAGIEEGKIRVITTVRDPRDIAVSIMTIRNRPFNAVLNMVVMATKQQSLWEENVGSGLYVYWYETFCNDLDILIKGITRVVNKQINYDEVKKLSGAYSFESNKIKSEEITKTEADFLFPGHIQNGASGKWMAKLEPKQVLQIQDAVGAEWMQYHGYELFG